MIRIALACLFALAVLSSTAFADVLVCDGLNEEYRCGSACQTTCATLGQRCPIMNVRCNNACYCKDGYARNRVGTCIPIKYCRRK